MDANLQEQSPDQSDSDDWTLLSFKATHGPSASATCKPTKLEASEKPQKSPTDDNLIEVDLEQSSDSTNSSFDRLNDELTPEEQHRTSNDLVVPGFQALDTTDDGETSQSESRHSSVSRSDAVCGELNRNLSRLSASASCSNSLLTRGLGRQIWQNEEFGDAEESDTEMEERGLLYDSSSRHIGSSRARMQEREHTRFMTKSFFNLIKLTMVALVFIPMWHFFLELQEGITKENPEEPIRKLEMEFSKFSDNPHINIAPELYAELQKVDDELSRCVKRQNPSWYNFYMSEQRFKESESKPHLSLKHYNGIVCYGQETQWRERFNKLREQKKLDLVRIMQEAKRAVANDLLGFYHPSLQFKLILNQLEYLEFLENKRNKKQSDETIKYLKVENMQLYRQLNDPSKSDRPHKSTKGLEWENLSLRQELDTLKARMNIKAGPSYIRQSQELELYERENVLLKHFLYDVSKDVSTISKQFNLHTIDASINLNDLEVLKFHTKTTKENLRKLSMRVSNVLVENMSLKEQLNDNYKLTTVNQYISTNLQEEEDSFIVKNNHSEALMKDGCIQNLLKLSKQAVLLENENKYLRNCCSKTSDQSLVTYQDSSSNLTRKVNHQEPAGISRQIAALATGLEKRIRNAVALAGSRSFDELSLFLEEFGNRIKSTSLVPQKTSSPEPSSGSVETSQEATELTEKPSYTENRMNVQSELDIKPLDYESISSGEDLNQNSEIKIADIPNSWFFDRAIQRKLLRNVHVNSKGSWRAGFKDKLVRESLNSGKQANSQKRRGKHNPVESKIKQRKSKKPVEQKNRKIKSQKYYRSEL